MNHESNAVAAAVPPVSGWMLHSGGRQFGPLGDEELRRFFSSGLVNQDDTLSHAELGLSESANEAAVRLQVAPPAAAARTAPLPLPVRHLSVQRVESTARRTMLLALVLLALVAVYAWMPRTPLRGPAPAGAGAGPGELAWVLEANRLEDSQQWTSAHVHAKRWLASAPSAYAWLYQGRALVQLGQHRDAERAFRDGLALSPEEPVLLSNLGALYAEQKDYARASAAYETVLRIRPDDFTARYGLGRIYSAQSRHADALAAYQLAAHARPGESGAWTEIGFELYRLGRMAEAVPPLEHAIALEKDFRRPQQILQAVRAALAGDTARPEIATAALAPDAAAAAPGPAPQAAAPVPVAATPVQAAAPAATWDPWGTEADSLEDAEDWTALRNLAERWTQAQPQRAHAWSALGTALRHLQQWQPAIEAHQRASVLAPNDSNVWFDFGLAHSANLDWQNAIPAYQRVLALNPRSDSAWNNLGTAYSGLKQDQPAIEAYQSAVRINPGNVVAWNNIGRIHYSHNRFKESIAAYEQSLRMAPDNETAKTGLQRAKQR